MEDIKERLRSYIAQNRKRCFALRDWLILKGETYTFNEALTSIYEAASGNFNTISDIIDHLTEKRKVQGRTQVYSNNDTDLIGLKRDENGKVVLFGYNPNASLQLKGQHNPHNNRIFRKSDDQVSKTYQNSVEKILNLGAQVRELYPGASNHDITFIMQAIKKYAERRHINTDKVINGIKKGRYEYDEQLDRIVPKTDECIRRTIIIDDYLVEAIADELNMTEYKFNSNIRQFLHDLLVKPSEAKVPLIFKQFGYNRSMLIYYLKKADLIRKAERISDRDSDGNPKTATMIIKYQVPKKHFERKLHKLYIRLFEDNSSKMKGICEDGEGATTCDASSGQFSQPLFPIQRRTFNKTSLGEDTTTFNTGDYQYSTPFIGDEETVKRKNGKGGSISVNY